MKIEINVQNAHLKAEEIQENHVTSIIEGFFGVLGVVKQVENNSSHCKKMNPLKNLGEAPAGYVPFQNVKTSAIAVSTKANKVEEKSQQISKVLPKINAERSLSAPIREVAKISLASDSEVHLSLVPKSLRMVKLSTSVSIGVIVDTQANDGYLKMLNMFTVTNATRNLL